MTRTLKRALALIAALCGIRRKRARADEPCVPTGGRIVSRSATQITIQFDAGDNHDEQC